MADKKKIVTVEEQKSYQSCLECKHERETGHRHTSGHTCMYQHELGHEPESETHYHAHKHQIKK